MTCVRASYAEKPKQELVRLDAFEILWSPLADPVDYGRTAALEFVAEVLEEVLPEQAPEDAVFRLALAVALIVRADVMARGTAMAAEYNARAQVASAYLKANEGLLQHH